MFREESGAVGLSGRDLPAAQALSGHASVLARAGQYEASGAFPGQTASSLQALAYLHLLNGVTAAGRDRVRPRRRRRTAGRHRARRRTTEDDGGRVPRRRSAPAPAGDDRRRRRRTATVTTRDLTAPVLTATAERPGGGPGPGGDDSPGGAAGQPALPEVTVPLATLQGRAERPGDNRLLGPLDPAMTRDLAAAAARSP